MIFLLALGSILSSSSLDSQFVRRGDSNTPSGSGASTPGDAAANESKLDDATKELNININNVNANTNTNTNAQPNGGSERKDGTNNNEADLSGSFFLISGFPPFSFILLPMKYRSSISQL